MTSPVRGRARIRIQVHVNPRPRPLTATPTSCPLVALMPDKPLPQFTHLFKRGDDKPGRVSQHSQREIGPLWSPSVSTPFLTSPSQHSSCSITHLVSPDPRPELKSKFYHLLGDSGNFMVSWGRSCFCLSKTGWRPPILES